MGKVTRNAQYAGSIPCYVPSNLTNGSFMTVFTPTRLRDTTGSTDRTVAANGCKRCQDSFFFLLAK
ncbi:hypothetical protein Rcae01_03913 [Novipirellula caenicola]|uniref:Uncharacterized protein n=1 Tax=Novipirellula caenicola TaxID=1536901 RepID=A0ABP9VX79_9BACT